jgi:hypothetical protein
MQFAFGTQNPGFSPFWNSVLRRLEGFGENSNPSVCFEKMENSLTSL